MKRLVGGALAATLALVVGSVGTGAQSSSNAAAETHIAAAKKAAGTEWDGVFTTTCRAGAPAAPAAARGAAPARPAGPPERSTWHAEPAKVFDNLYFLGQTEYSVWAVNTSAGIIVIDTIFDYSVEDEVVGGLKKLGLDPAHDQVRHRQPRPRRSFRRRQVSAGSFQHARDPDAAADWDLLDRSTGTKPTRDMVATDGMKLTLGDTTLTMYLTPGHTLGTISTLIPVKDHGQPHLVAEWGGTAFNWLNNGGSAYITPERPATFWFQSYIDSAKRFRDIAAKEGADVIIANHTIFDGSKTKLPALQTRKAGDPNPYVVGKEGVLRYMTVAEECAEAGLLKVSK